jgi:hypothetical protein
MTGASGGSMRATGAPPSSPAWRCALIVAASSARSYSAISSMPPIQSW